MHILGKAEDVSIKVGAPGMTLAFPVIVSETCSTPGSI